MNTTFTFLIGVSLGALLGISIGKDARDSEIEDRCRYSTTPQAYIVVNDAIYQCEYIRPRAAR